LSIRQSPPRSALFPYTTLFRSYEMADLSGTLLLSVQDGGSGYQGVELWKSDGTSAGTTVVAGVEALSRFTVIGGTAFFEGEDATDRKSTRLNSSHQIISYAVFC